ncbi:MAG: CCA tRNA nucleotidyltransferase [Paracoccaceae bacterium]
MTQIAGAWLTHAGTQAVLRALTDGGYAAYLVGGCVRNALLGAPVGDIDIATSATPDQTTACAHSAGLRPIPTGADHGTITVMAQGRAHEVTTFRADVDTDGRHAVVRFSTCIDEDAQRRDFTMNALYADADGRVIDPLGGWADVLARRVRFIGSPHQRLAEDHLRSLRYFRFCAWYGDPDHGFEPDALDAIARNLDGLDGLSRERVGAELTKLLTAPDPAPAIAAMSHTGALGRVLPQTDPRALAPLLHVEHLYGVPPDALRRLAVLGWRDGAALRLSRAQSRRLVQMADLIGQLDPAEALSYRHGADMALDVLLLRAALLDTPMPQDHAARIAMGAQAVCPVSARDLMPDLSGPALGARLREIESHWIASGMTLDRAALLRT